MIEIEKKLSINIITAIIILTSSLSAFGQSSRTIKIEKGRSEVIKVDFIIEEVFSADIEICRPGMKSDNEVILVGMAVGDTNVFILGTNTEKENVTVIVQDKGSGRELSELKEILKSIHGVKTRTVGRKLIVEGEVFTKKDLNMVSRIVDDVPNVVNLVELSPLMKKILKEEIEKALRADGIRGVHVNAGRNKYILAGKVDNEADASRAEKIALAFTPSVINAIRVEYVVYEEEVTLIEMNLNIMEIEKNALRDLGIHWNPGASLSGSGTYSGASGQKPSLAGSIAGTLSNLLPKMRKIQDIGKGRSLMQQTVMTKSGGTANFFAGSEIPIPVTQEGGTMSVEYKKVGVTMNFSPTLDSRENIVTPIKIESSRVTGEGPGGMPVLASSQLDTVLSVASGNSIALAGLVGQRELELDSKSPENRGSALFQKNKSRRESNQANEVIIFVTPRILAAGEPSSIGKIKDKVDQSFKDEELERMRKLYKQKTN